MARLEWQDPNLRADLFQRRPFFRVQRGRSVVATFDINGGPHFFEQVGHTHLRKNNGIVHASERRDDFSTIAFRVQGTARPLQRPNGIIAVERDGERVAERTRGLEIANVTGVQQIKTAIRQDKLAALRAQRVGDGRETIWVDEFFHSWRGDDKLQRPRQHLKLSRFVADQLAVHIEPHPWSRIHGYLCRAAENDRIAGKMIAESDLRGKQREFGGRAFLDQNDVEQSIIDRGPAVRSACRRQRSGRWRSPRYKR